MGINEFCLVSIRVLAMLQVTPNVNNHPCLKLRSVKIYEAKHKTV